MFGIGANELLIILLFGFLIFGPDKMPAMAKTIGKAISKFRTAQEEMNNVIKNEVYDPSSEDPFSNPLDALSKVEKKVNREDRGESFTERKARYDRQRAAQKAAKDQAEGATTAAAGASAARAAQNAQEEKHLKGIAESKAALDRARAAQAEQAAEDSASNEDAASKSASSKSADASTEDKDDKKPTPDELYGVKPRARKPSAKKASERKPSVQKVPARKPMAPISNKAAEPELQEATDDVAPDDANASAQTGKGE